MAETLIDKPVFVSESYNNDSLSRSQALTLLTQNSSYTIIVFDFSTKKMRDMVYDTFGISINQLKRRIERNIELGRRSKIIFVTKNTELLAKVRKTFKSVGFIYEDEIGSSRIDVIHITDQ